jgi:diaminopimelate epimerase
VVGTPVTTGSAHYVALVEELPGDEAFFALSPAIETDPMFPERVSVMWTQAVSDRRLKLRIWERGVGETLGCGTGSSAAALVWARSKGLLGEFVVENPGGELKVALAGYDAPIASVSRPRIVFDGVWG